jgi:hypothetical protein
LTFNFVTDGDPVNFNILSFNGVHVSDMYDTAPSFLGVSIASADGLTDFGASDIAFDANNIWIDFAGSVFANGAALTLDVILA